MYCPYCGAPMPDCAAFCSACGAPNNAAENRCMVPVRPDPAVEQLSGDILRWGILGLAFASNIPILGIIFSKIGRNKALNYLEQVGPWTGKTKVGAILAKAGIIVGWCALAFIVTYIILYAVLVGLLIGGIN